MVQICFLFSPYYTITDLHKDEITLLEHLFGHIACSELTTLIAEG
jgi:hypothetical protein